MRKYTRKRLKLILKDIESNFGEVIDYIIYYDSISEDAKAWDIIYAIENLGHEQEIELLLSDFETRGLTKGPMFLYNALLYGLVNYDEARAYMTSILKQGQYTKFKEHLATLNEEKGRDGDRNIAEIMGQLCGQNKGF